MKQSGTFCCAFLNVYEIFHVRVANKLNFCPYIFLVLFILMSLMPKNRLYLFVYPFFSVCGPLQNEMKLLHPKEYIV